MSTKYILSGLKIIGVAIFVWILLSIDRTKLIESLSRIDPLHASLAVVSLFGVYTVKSIRWHTIVRATGMHPKFSESWRLYFIGIFLGNITPAKLGELGRAAYLKKKGLPLKIGILLSLADRAFDVGSILILSIIGLAVLGWPEWSLIILGTMIFACVIIFLLLMRKRRMRIGMILMKFFLKFVRPSLIANVTFHTIVSWVFYFLWAIFFARSLGIDISELVLVASFTITGLFSMLPIAPSGLGTRDAALIFLLAPYGVSAETAVALAMLMFLSTMLGGLLGGIYWLSGPRAPRRR